MSPKSPNPEWHLMFHSKCGSANLSIEIQRFSIFKNYFHWSSRKMCYETCIIIPTQCKFCIINHYCRSCLKNIRWVWPLCSKTHGQHSWPIAHRIDQWDTANIDAFEMHLFFLCQHLYYSWIPSLIFKYIFLPISVPVFKEVKVHFLRKRSPIPLQLLIYIVGNWQVRGVLLLCHDIPTLW